MANYNYQKNPIIDLDPSLLSTIFEAQTNWHVITGAPCSGKTTIIDLLSKKGYKIVPEVGRMYVEEEISKGRTLEEIRKNCVAFDYAICELTLKIESDLQHKEVLFLDRAFPDSLAFFQQFGLDPNEILPKCFHHHYASVFVLDRFPSIKDAARIEDDIAADFLDKQLASNYRALGYAVVRVPAYLPEERCMYILDKLYTQGLTA